MAEREEDVSPEQAPAPETKSGEPQSATEEDDSPRTKSPSSPTQSPAGATPAASKPEESSKQPPAQKTSGPPAPETQQEKKAREFLVQAEKKMKSSQSFFGGLFGLVCVSLNAVYIAQRL